MSSKRTKTKGSLKNRRQIFYLLIALPAVIYIIINNYIPMFGIIMAFKKMNVNKGILGSDWVGLKNFKFLFAGTDAWLITRNTIIHNLVFMFFNIYGAAFLAILLSRVRNSKVAQTYQGILLFPHLISTVILAYIVFGFLSGENGVINNGILKPLGRDTINWYAAPKYWWFILPLVNAFRSIGYFCIIFYASVLGIDESINEAAVIDGASGFQVIWHITLPLIRPTLITMTLLQLGRIFSSDFGLFYQVPMQSGALMPTTNVISTYVYRALMNLGDSGMSTAASLYQSVVGLIMVLIANTVVRRISKSEALF